MSIFRKPELAKVVFSSDYIYGISTKGSYQNFDVNKYKKIRDNLIEKRYLKTKNILRPHLCSYDEIRLVHEESFIKRIQDPNYISSVLKIDLVGHWDNYVLEYFRAVTGGTLMATAYALHCGIPVFNLGGGFHHAHPDRAEGFCLINDVAIAIEKFRIKKKARRFMIIDLDYHQGNGNLLFFNNNKHVFTFSMHADSWVDVHDEYNRDIVIPADCDNETYMQILNSELVPLYQEHKPDIVFYIAGSDPYEKDTLAGMKLTRTGMLERNKFVYQLVRGNKVPLVILAGGGYGPDSWEIYYDFIEYGLTQKMKKNGI